MVSVLEDDVNTINHRGKKRGRKTTKGKPFNIQSIINH